MFSSMKALTRCRISLISGVIFRSGIGSSLSGRELLEPSQALFPLPRRLSDCRNNVHDGCGYAVFAIGPDLVPARFRAAVDEYLLDDVRWHEPNRLLTLAGLPGPHHRTQRLTAAEPLVKRVVVGCREVTRDDEAPNHLGGVLVLSCDDEYSAGDVRPLLPGRFCRVVGDRRDLPRVIRGYVVRDYAVGFGRAQAQHLLA